MLEHVLSDEEQELIKRYQISKDEDIAIYFFNKMGKDMLDVIYSKINLKFSSIPFEKEDLTCFVWKSLKKGLELYKQNKEGFWSNWFTCCYSATLKEIKKYFSNGQLIMNYADSWETYAETHCILKQASALVDMPKQSYRDILKPIIDYVSKHTKTYTKTDIKKVLYLKSFGYSEREISKRMNVSRRYIRSILKFVLKTSKRFLSTSNR